MFIRNQHKTTCSYLGKFLTANLISLKDLETFIYFLDELYKIVNSKCFQIYWHKAVHNILLFLMFLVIFPLSFLIFNSVQFSSVAQSCPTLCDPMNHSTPGLSVHYQLPEFTQTHAHRVGDAIQPFYPLLSPSPPAPNPSQHQGLFQ